MNVVTESAKEAFNNMGIQLISFVLLIVIADVVPYLLLSIVRMPAGVRNLISTIVALFVMYYGFMGISTVNL